jgi:hypothetical protein
MRKINKIYILVKKWKLFVLKRKITSRQANTGNPLFRKKKKKKKLVTKQLYSYTLDAIVVHLTLTCTCMRTPLNQTSCLKGSSMDSFNLGLLPRLDLKN